MSDYFDDKDTSTPRHEPTHQPEPAPRAEPHLGDTRSQPRQEEAPAGSGLAHERRDERRYIRVSPTFEVRFDDGNRFRGLDLSQGGFAIESPRPMRQDARVRGSIAITTASGELLVPVSAQCRHSLALEGRGGAHHAGFEITDISPSHLELLRRVVRAHLAGRPLDVEQMVQGEDAQTPRKRRGTGSTPQAAARPPRPMGRYVALFIGFAVLAVVAAATAYRNFMLIEPNFAAVTAPRIDIRAPSPGILMAHELKAGDRVTRDEQLTRVKDVDLESDLILAEAAALQQPTDREPSGKPRRRQWRTGQPGQLRRARQR